MQPFLPPHRPDLSDWKPALDDFTGPE